jgi:hypothetical protein
MMARMILQISLGINQYPMMERACAKRRDQLSASKSNLPCSERHLAGLYLQEVVGCFILKVWGLDLRLCRLVVGEIEQ